jgi:hypothetical protein
VARLGAGAVVVVDELQRNREGIEDYSHDAGAGVEVEAGVVAAGTAGIAAGAAVEAADVAYIAALIEAVAGYKVLEETQGAVACRIEAVCHSSQVCCSFLPWQIYRERD